jgi:hypothetical protein
LNKVPAEYKSCTDTLLANFLGLHCGIHRNETADITIKEINTIQTKIHVIQLHEHGGHATSLVVSCQFPSWELCMTRVTYYRNLPEYCVNKAATATADFDNVIA